MAAKMRLTGYANDLAICFATPQERNVLSQADGLEHFIRTMRPKFIKGAAAVFLYRFIQLMSFRRGNGGDLTKWQIRLQTLLRWTYDAWNDAFEIPARRIVRVVDQNGVVRDVEEDDGVYLPRVAQERIDHRNNFPITDNLMALLMIAFADLNPHDRQQFTFQMGKLPLVEYSTERVKSILTDLLINPRTSVDNPHLHGGHSLNKAFMILDEGTLYDTDGYWCVDEETELEGFLEKDADTFWTCEDEVNESWQSVRFKGRHTKKGKGKGRGKGRGKGHRFFKKRKGSGSFAHQAESTEETSQQALTDLVAKAVHEAMFGKGKGKRNKGKGKGKPNTSPDDLSTKGQGKPKGKGKGKGGKKGKAYEASGESSVPTASATEDWKEEEWDQSWEESGWDENSWYSGDWSTAVTPWSFYVESYECFASAVPGSYVYDLSKEATLCVLDLACTKGMTSRHAAQKLMQAIDAGKVAGVAYELAPTKSIFGFANGSSMELTEKIVLWFEQGPNFPYLHTLTFVSRGKPHSLWPSIKCRT